jgi:AraC-like DNA-binding protein
MLGIERLSTDRVPARHKLEYWNNVTSETYLGTCVDFGDRHQNASMLRWRVGDLSMIRAKSDALVVQRRPMQSDISDQQLVLHLQHRGAARYNTSRGVAQLEHASFALSPSHLPYRIDVSDRHEMLVVEFPRASLTAQMPDLGDFLEREVILHNATGSVLHDFLLSLWRHGEMAQLDPDWGAAMSSMFMNLVSLTLRATVGEPLVENSFLQRVKAIVQIKLCDADLNTLRIAQDLGVSERTIQNAFSSIATTPSAYILECRLQLAAEQLRVHGFRKITDIALDVGFNDSTYFTRCFRTRFGMSPGEWRTGKPKA